MHQNQNDGLRCLIRYLLRRPESEATLYSEEKRCVSYVFIGFIRLTSLMIWISRWETFFWFACSKRSQIHHCTAPIGLAVKRPTDTIWSYANFRTEDFNSTHYLWFFLQLSTLSITLLLPCPAEWLTSFLEVPVWISGERSVVVTEA
jgi:hypothetical protein